MLNLGVAPEFHLRSALARQCVTDAGGSIPHVGNRLAQFGKIVVDTPEWLHVIIRAH